MSSQPEYKAFRRGEGGRGNPSLSSPSALPLGRPDTQVSLICTLALEDLPVTQVTLRTGCSLRSVSRKTKENQKELLLCLRGRFSEL